MTGPGLKMKILDLIELGRTKFWNSWIASGLSEASVRGSLVCATIDNETFIYIFGVRLWILL